MPYSNFTQQRVFIVGTGSLLDEGITHLLTLVTDLQVSYAKYSDDFAFLENIQRIWPDVILVSQDGSLDSAHILDLLSSHPAALRSRIIIVQLHSTVVDIYDRPTLVAGKMSRGLQQIMVRARDDLLNAVHDIPFRFKVSDRVLAVKDLYS